MEDQGNIWYDDTDRSISIQFPFPSAPQDTNANNSNCSLNAEGSLLKWAQHPWSLIIIFCTYAVWLQEIIRFVCQIGNPEKLICYDMLSKIFKQQNPNATTLLKYQITSLKKS